MSIVEPWCRFSRQGWASKSLLLVLGQSRLLLFCFLELGLLTQQQFLDLVFVRKEHVVEFVLGRSLQVSILLPSFATWIPGGMGVLNKNEGVLE